MLPLFLSVIYSPLVSFQIPGDFHFFPCFLTLPLHFNLQEEEIYPSCKRVFTTMAAWKEEKHLRLEVAGLKSWLCHLVALFPIWAPSSSLAKKISRKPMIINPLSCWSKILGPFLEILEAFYSNKSPPMELGARMFLGLIITGTGRRVKSGNTTYNPD